MLLKNTGVMVKNLYDKEVYDAVVKRTNLIELSSSALWGKMNSAQMMAHCAELLEVYNGQKPWKDTTFLARLFRGLIKRAILSPKPYKHNSPTSPQLRITNERDFNLEKTRLLQALHFFYEMDKIIAINFEHPLLGKMTLEERGWAMYKHLDHHLRQFGV